MPNNNSIVRITDFDSPKKLADHLRLVNNNDKMYNKYLDHKIHQKIQNEELVEQLKQRKYETNSIIEDFECFVCQQSVDGPATAATIATAPQKSKDMCSVEPIYPQMRTKIGNSKANLMKQGECEANLLRSMILNNQPFTQQQMTDELVARYNSGVCKM